MNLTEKEQSVHLTEYYYILTKHKSLIIASFVITVALTLFFTLLMKPVYRATATIVIEKQQSTSPLTGERLDYESYVSQSLTFNTHFKLITSRSVLEQVIKNLKLDREKELEVSFIKKLLGQFKKNIRLLLGLEEKLLSPHEKLTQLIKKLQKKIDIEEVRDTRLLRVNVEDHDPAMARDIANVLAKAYIDFDINNRLTSSHNTLSWLTDHLYEMKKELEDAEEEFLAYKQRETLISVEESQKIIAQKITEFNDAYIQARNRRLELDAKLAQLEVISKSGKDIPNLRSLIASEFIDDLYGQLMNAEVELSHLMKIYKSKHNKVIQTKTRIDDIRKKLRQEMRKELDNLKAERTVLLSKEKVLQKTMADFEKEAMEINKKELNFNILKRNVEMNQNLYDTILARLKEADITGNVDVSNIRITDKAVLPNAPVRPNKLMNVILSIIFGLMTGIGVSFLWEYLDRTLRTEEDIQRYLGLPVLSVIPLADQVEAKGNEVRK
ncbi:MAG: GumC family protein [Deltaproteobacteria bacterium]|nr:GumC family protein [Deltaproteobacteria bacterium]MDL2121927.1 GumC family protein [Deltaproteobacteria bacterium]